MHIKVVRDFVLIELLILVILHHLEMSVLVVCAPVRILDLVNPLIRARRVSRLLDFFSTLSEPIVDVRKIVRFEASIHGFNTIPRHIAA